MSISVNVQVEYQRDEGGESLCFTHAVKRAMAGEKINTFVDDFDSYMAHLSCVDCDEEDSD